MIFFLVYLESIWVKFLIVFRVKGWYSREIVIKAVCPCPSVPCGDGHL